MTRVGFVGLGSQGGPMARRIVDAGFATTLWARRPASLEPFADTAAAVADSPAALGAASDVLGVCVLHDAGVDAVLRGPDGALSTMADGGVVVIHSTVHPDTCVRLQADFPHLRVLDAPVSGGGHKAVEGELLVMVGGPEDALEVCRPVLEAFGDPILHVGPLGAGQEVKVLNNAVFTAQLAIAADAFDLAASHHLDRQSVATVLSSGSGRSYAAEVLAGVGFGLDALAPLAGPLLAKDVGILVQRAGPEGSVLLATADAALTRMGHHRSAHPKRPGTTTADDTYRAVMLADPPAAATPSDAAEREHRFGSVWSRPGLSVRDRRIVTIVCASAAVDQPLMDAHVHAALASGDLTVDQLNEITLQFAVYCGWPRAAQLELTVRGQWHRLHAERGEETPPFPMRDDAELEPSDAAERLAAGAETFRDVALIDPPGPDSPYFHAGILSFVFGHLGRRPGLSRRDRRLVTIPCAGVSDAPGPIWSHVTSALDSGDVSYDEMQEIVLHFGAYSGETGAVALLEVATGWQQSQR